uniref:CASP-like protein n=1 Tax=Oryza meridionalis TaxID=40149 RepID=A0A0E0DSE3_9ORYZ
MWEVAWWRPGTWGGLAMRVGQVAFAGASIGVMASGAGFANYTAFCYLIASMGLQSLWSLGLACLDVYALTVKRDLNNALLISSTRLFVIVRHILYGVTLPTGANTTKVPFRGYNRID